VREKYSSRRNKKREQIVYIVTLLGKLDDGGAGKENGLRCIKTI
jgi:hypothetical protein